MANTKQRRKCFIITPIGESNSSIFRKAKGVIDSVIKPVLEDNGYDDIKPAYEINVSGMINTQIINRIIDDDLVIANLTGNNPNVMYELCLRHIVAKPIIHICENGTVLPFDIKDNRTIFYENDMLGVDELKNQLVDFIRKIDYDKEYLDNPIYSAYRMGKLLKTSFDSEDNVQSRILIEILDGISELKNKNVNSNDGNLKKVYAINKKNCDSTLKVDYEITEDMIYAINDLRDTGIPEKLTVIELADKLKTTCNNIRKIALKSGIDAKLEDSELSKNDIEKIIELMISEYVPGDDILYWNLLKDY